MSIIWRTKKKFIYCLLGERKSSGHRINFIEFYLFLFSTFIDVVRPLTVKIIQDLKFMSTKQSYDLRCEVRGSRPPPRISWWLGSSKLTETKESVGIAVFISHILRFQPNSTANPSFIVLIIFEHTNAAVPLKVLSLLSGLISKEKQNNDLLKTSRNILISICAMPNCNLFQAK